MVLFSARWTWQVSEISILLIINTLTRLALLNIEDSFEVLKKGLDESRDDALTLADTYIELKRWIDDELQVSLKVEAIF